MRSNMGKGITDFHPFNSLTSQILDPENNQFQVHYTFGWSAEMKIFKKGQMCHSYNTADNTI